ncbi:MAG: HlyD family type I secretion periplasmic adaptor subunit [Alphaproteobacteria bacterium]|nr:HlyD family type I secretion periplasmic adaptor subunit [Alphaproteobacteria bacterium]
MFKFLQKHEQKITHLKQQVAQAQENVTRHFEVDEDLSMARHMMLMGILAFFVLFFLWANLAHLEEVARGEGKVIPSSDIHGVGVLEPGIVQEILVKEGQDVRAGDVLLRVSDIQASSDLGAVRARYLGLLAATARLDAEAQGLAQVTFPPEVMNEAAAAMQEEGNAFAANQRQMADQAGILRQQLQQKEQELAGLKTRAEDTRAVLKLQEEEKAVIEPLVKRGSAARMELLQLERAVREKTGELNGTLSAMQAAQSAVDEAQARLAELTTAAQAKAQAELAIKRAELDEIRQRMAGLSDRKTRTELRAPVDGTIQEIAVNTVGGVTRPGQDVVKIVPKDDVLIVEAQIKPSDRAVVFPGQKAIIKITAYDYSIYGGLEGEVLDISADSIEDERKNVYYRVRLRTADKNLHRHGQAYPIVPGMVATAEILTGRKTVMQYLLKPLIKTMDVAFSER